MRDIRKAALLAGCAGAAVLAPLAARAQTTPTTTEQPPPATFATPAAPAAPATSTTQPAPTQTRTQATTPASGNEVSEIVVTANKREERINRVGLTVTAISGAQLAAQRITSVQDVAAAVPGLQFSQSGSNTPIYTLRGVGFNETTLGVFPAVSVYIDEVPLQFPVMTLHSAFDLERIEALKGPQGTLFGENSTGGAINYIAAKPTDTFQAGGDVSYGRFNQVDGNAFVSGPINDKVSARLSITGEHADGWQYSYTRPGDHNGAIDYVAGRLIVDYKPTDAIRLSFRLDAWRDTSEPEAPQLIAIRPQQPANVHANVLNYPFAPTDSDRAADFSTGAFHPSSDRRFIQGAVRADWDITTWLTLTSLTSYSHLDQNLSADEDGTALLIANLVPSNGRINTFNQELRAAGTSTQFRWVAGGNYERDYTNENQTLNFGDGSSSNAGTLFINTTGSLNTANIQNYAFFGNVEYDILPQLTLKGGVRYTNSENHTNLRGIGNGDGNVSTLFNVLGGLLGRVPFTPVGVGGNYVLNNNGVPGSPFISNLNEDNVSWRVGADYRLNDATLLYANVSRGYKAGSYPTLSASTFAQYQPVTQESVTAYEGGFKAGLFDHRIQLNAAGFYYEYNNKQIRGKIVDPVFDVLDILINVPKSHVAGGEADLTYRVMRDLSLTASVTYLKSGVDRYTGPSVYGQTTNFAGADLPFTPEWSYAFSADYKKELPNGGRPFIGVSLRGQSTSVATLGGNVIPFITGASYRNVAGLTRPFLLPDYTTVDGRIGYEFPNHKLTISAYAKNLFNEVYFTNAAQFLDVTVRYPGLPATYGVSASFKY